VKEPQKTTPDYTLSAHLARRAESDLRLLIASMRRLGHSDAEIRQAVDEWLDRERG